MQQAFDSAVVHATEFLKSLPRMREDVRSANERLNQFRSDHPEVRADLLIDQPPGSTEVDYDLQPRLPRRLVTRVHRRLVDGALLEGRQRRSVGGQIYRALGSELRSHSQRT